MNTKSHTNSTTIYYTYLTTPIGKILLSSSNAKLIGLHIEQQKHFPIIGESWDYNMHMPIFNKVNIQLDEYFNAKRTHFEIEHALNGTPFQQHIWQSLAIIPCGTVLSYKTFASLTSYPNAIRAVASAIAKNPLSILLPCHRIVRSNGSLGEYAAGVDIKEALLKLEQNVQTE
ncbi:methylated-DNA--[protein]-cysteine S-methyltransferase [Cardinium endosymbiont of Tipula unca]|uniref:methylated-DNA--[protein]-cysteine S-methyltransferase n=1 Tax=Cardinium endosymbiont of Tipula unca TaxID=3066216 RepID=UPI0030D281C7